MTDKVFDFDEMLDGLEEAIEIKKGNKNPSRIFAYTPVDVQNIRNKTNKSQSAFARMIGVSVATLRNWEQGRRKPTGPALALLKIVDSNPEYVESILYKSN